MKAETLASVEALAVVTAGSVRVGGPVARARHRAFCVDVPQPPDQALTSDARGMTDETASRGAREDAEAVVNPRLIDGFRLNFNQDDVPFAVPHLREDLPFAVDPFLLWSSGDPERQQLHEHLTRFLELVVRCALGGDRDRAAQLLLGASEARELGLGFGRGTKQGSAIGPQLARSAVDILTSIPQLQQGGISHLEILGLVVPMVAQDRVSDLTASVLKKWFIDFTQEQASAFGIPTTAFAMDAVWDWDAQMWRTDRPKLPYNPLDGSPLLFAPLDVLRHLPWINYEDYFKTAYSRLVLPAGRRTRRPPKEIVLEYNRRNFSTVETYIDLKEKQAPACKADPLFQPLGLPTLRKKLAELRKVETGKTDWADKRFESLAYDLLSSLLYPELEFADRQVRTVEGTHIRDIIFYNDGKNAFLADLRKRYGARQVVFELKNVKALDGAHVNQLYRYLDHEFGAFGVLVARHPLQNSIRKNVVDLHSSKRAAIIVLDDTDFELMVNLVESNRRPIEALKKRFIEFTRWLPK
ncbi:MAG TPA: hypothetical protein VK988_10935 [Acidimicrobiales bacterium]|nr:hypothetical protein [Acidimicrobiales bacterium]